MFDISAGVSFQIVFLFLFMVSSLEIDVAFIFAFFIRYIFLPTCSDIAVKLPHRGDGVVALDESLECALSNRTSLAQNVPSISSLQCWNFLNLTMAPEYEGSTFTAFSDTQYEKEKGHTAQTVFCAFLASTLRQTSFACSSDKPRSRLKRPWPGYQHHDVPKLHDVD